jgi:hypothetical protein
MTVIYTDQVTPGDAGQAGRGRKIGFLRPEAEGCANPGAVTRDFDNAAQGRANCELTFVTAPCICVPAKCTSYPRASSTSRLQRAK